jgi:hypothetical protein
MTADLLVMRGVIVITSSRSSTPQQSCGPPRTDAFGRTSCASKRMTSHSLILIQLIRNLLAILPTIIYLYNQQWFPS